MNVERTAQRFADRPGFTLVSYGAVGLPFFRLQVRVLLLERKRIGPFQEFALRAVATGVNKLTDIGRLLGLDKMVLEQTLADLLLSNDLGVQSASGADASSLRLTEKGLRTLAEAEQVQPTEEVLEIDFDGLLRKPYLYVDGLVTPRQLREQVGREIPPSPSRPPDVGDIDSDALQRIVREFADRRHVKADLMGVIGIQQRQSFFLPAAMLVYQAKDGDDVQVGFAIDDRMSPEHEAAFARARLRKRFAIGASDGHTAESVAASLLGENLVASADRDLVLRLHRSIAESMSDDPDDSESPKSEQAVAAQQQLTAMAVRPLEVFEHAGYLREAMSSAAERLLIMSPWIRRAVVNQEFVRQLEALLTKGVEVYVGWGFSKTEMDLDGPPDVRMDLDRLASRYTNFHFRWLGDTHAKVLLCDTRFVIVGSFNWLSFRGDPRRTFKDERGMLVTLPLVIEEQFESLVTRFADAATA